MNWYTLISYNMNVGGAQGGASWACTYNRIENPEHAESDIVCKNKSECAASVQGAAGACRERAGNTEWNERAGAIKCSYSSPMLEWVENVRACSIRNAQVYKSVGSMR